MIEEQIALLDKIAAKYPNVSLTLRYKAGELESPNERWTVTAIARCIKCVDHYGDTVKAVQWYDVNELVASGVEKLACEVASVSCPNRRSRH